MFGLTGWQYCTELCYMSQDRRQHLGCPSRVPSPGPGAGTLGCPSSVPTTRLRKPQQQRTQDSWTVSKATSAPLCTGGLYAGHFVLQRNRLVTFLWAQFVRHRSGQAVGLIEHGAAALNMVATARGAAWTSFVCIIADFVIILVAVYSQDSVTECLR